MIYIYTLNTIDGVPKYVGKTKNLKYRKYQHIWESKNGATYRKATWLRSCDYNFTMDVIDEDDWCFWESYWIETVKSWGFDLLNHTYGCDGRLGDKHSEETKLKMSLTKKGKKPKNLDSLIKTQKNKSIKIFQYNLDGTLVGMYPSKNIADKKTGIHNINRSMRTGNTAGGFYWSRDKNFTI